LGVNKWAAFSVQLQYVKLSLHILPAKLTCNSYCLDTFIKSLKFSSEFHITLSIFYYFVMYRIRNELLEKIRNYESLTESVEEPRILLIGQIGDGKSSFFNSVNSVFRGHVMLQARSGFGVTSISKKYRTYPVHDGKGGRKLPFILCDTMGLERNIKDEGIHVEDIISIIKGHVPDMYEVRLACHFTDVSPGLADKVHCVVFVVEANKISLLNQNLLNKFESIRTEVSNMGIPVLGLVTKIDGACLEVTNDLTKVYRSRYIYQKMLRVSLSSISPVKNYSAETELNLHVDILILTALQQMLRAADFSKYFTHLLPYFVFFPISPCLT
uniref:G domain-containing protein n=1 Tax=Erpetoichthys calabaricus TaxID=27687 RepID=A0A8C4T1D0_ERPCA